MTRAKENLYIRCNTGISDRYQIPDVEKLTDETQYPEPEKITLQLTHKDVVLDYFKNKKEIIFKLRSGMKLSLNDVFWYAELDGRTVRVAKLSKACMANLEQLQQKRYRPCGAAVRFVVAWKGEKDTEDTEDTAVLLSDVYLTKH